MLITDETVAGLRAAATSGELDATRELGRLLCLLPADPAELDLPYLETDQTWPEERWLRTVVNARPEDTLAATLLAGRLVQQIDHALNDWNTEDGDVLASKRDEAERLYARVLQADAADPTAHAGLARLAELFGESPPEPEPALRDQYGFYLAEAGYLSGSSGGGAYLVVADLGELRWALDVWLKLHEGFWTEESGLGGAWFTINTVAQGVQVSEIDLERHIVGGSIDWDSLTIPSLPAAPLPAGHPGRLGDLLHDYGYRVEAL